MSTSNKPIIGLAGTFASGKDTLADHLVKTYGFVHYSTGDIVREETLVKYGLTDRPILQKHANEMRAERGPGVLVDIALERYRNSQNKGVVVSGIRSIGEAEAIKRAGGKLVFVDADIKTRYERAYTRQRDVEKSMTFEEFRKSERQESNKPRTNKTEQNISGVKELSDIVLSNDGAVAEFINAAEAKLKLI